MADGALPPAQEIQKGQAVRVTEFTLFCTGYLAGALTRLDDVRVLDVVVDEDGNATPASSCKWRRWIRSR